MKQLQKTDNRVATLRGMLDQSKEQVANALPVGTNLTPERVARITMTSLQKNPSLLKCNPQSILACVIQSAQLGLEPGGALGEAYLVPFKDTAQFIIGYRGLISLARRSGEIVSIAAHCVYEKDFFVHEYGLDEKLIHRPALTDSGKMIAVYGVAKLKDGGHAFEVMSKEDIDKVRNISKAKNAGPWVDHYDEMARKTVIRRLAKYLPVSVEMMRAVEVDADRAYGLEEIPDIPKVDTNARFSGEVIEADEEPSKKPHRRPAVLGKWKNKASALETADDVDSFRFSNHATIENELPHEEDQNELFGFLEELYKEKKGAEGPPKEISCPLDETGATMVNPADCEGLDCREGCPAVG